jgi:hypothetical protein
MDRCSDRYAMALRTHSAPGWHGCIGLVRLRRGGQLLGLEDGSFDKAHVIP